MIRIIVTVVLISFLCSNTSKINVCIANIPALETNSLAADFQEVLIGSTNPPVVLDASPLRSEEILTKEASKELSEFIRYISPEEMDMQVVLFYQFIKPRHKLMPRLIRYLVEDANAVKLHAIENKIAILITEKFDVEQLDKNLINMNMPFTKISRQEFFAD